MTDYISREDAASAKVCYGVSCKECSFCNYGATIECKLYERIRNLPAADVAPVVHAEWVMTKFVLEDTGIWWSWRCSNCGEKYIGIGKLDMRQHKYCSSCGAKMDGGERDGQVD